MSQKDVRLSPDLIDQLNALASRLTAQGEYEACDLIDTVVARVTAMPQRELLAEALSALEAMLTHPRVVNGILNDTNAEEDAAKRKARAAADKIRAALTQEKQT